MIQQVVGVFAMNVAIFKFGQIVMMIEKGATAKRLFAKNATIITRIGVGAIDDNMKCLHVVKAAGAKVYH